MSPIYSYKCQKCGWQISINKAIADRDQVPMCGDCCEQMVREYHAPGMILKGNGWGSKP